MELVAGRIWKQHRVRNSDRVQAGSAQPRPIDELLRTLRILFVQRVGAAPFAHPSLRVGADGNQQVEGKCREGF